MGLKEEIIDGVKEALKEKEELKEKKWRLPFRARVGKGKQKKNWVGILKFNENGAVEPSKQQIIDQTVIVDGVPRLATGKYVFKWIQKRKQFPVILLPSCSVKPLEIPKVITGEDMLQKSLEDGTNIKGYKILMSRMLSSQLTEKKPMSKIIFWVIGILIVGVIAYAMFTGAF